MEPRGSVHQLGFRPGTPVEVRARFDSRWKRGFEVVACHRDSVQVRRLSDGAVLPELPVTDVRPAE